MPNMTTEQQYLLLAGATEKCPDVADARRHGQNLPLVDRCTWCGGTSRKPLIEGLRESCESHGAGPYCVVHPGGWTPKQGPEALWWITKYYATQGTASDLKFYVLGGEVVLLDEVVRRVQYLAAHGKCKLMEVQDA